ncbi:MAG: FimV/HubP family polar landmark protein [Methylotenera sp.]
MHKSKLKKISLAVCLALMPFSSYAAGLGKLNVSSGLGEPLKAEIELLSVSPEELSTLVATIASEEAYMAQGITRLGIHSNIKVEIAKNADGSPMLKLRSSQPVGDPYLDMLIQVDWASGRLQREYTVLLDPPGYRQSTNNVSIIPVMPPSVNGASSSDINATRSSIKKAKKIRKTPNQTSVPQDEHLESTGVQKLTTKRGDSLNSIAKEVQVEGVSLDQMLVGLYENNKEAFISGNMNRLKVGKIIKVPTKESLISVDVQQAKQSVKVHSANWNAYRNTLAGTVAAAPAMVEVEQKQTASGKIATAEDKTAPVKAGPQDVVKLSAGEKELAKSGKDANGSVDAKIVALQEESAAREKSLKEAQERTAALEKQIQDMQKLLALKSQTMTDVQTNAEIAAKTPDAKSETKTEAAEAAAPSAVKPVDSSATTAPVERKVAAQPQVQSQPKVQPEPQAEPSLLDSLMSAVDLTILGAVSGIALLGAGWMYLRNKRRKDLDSFERGILTSGGLRANTVFGNTTGNASTSDTSFLTDFAQSADGSMIDTNDVDPIAEAEVYMAYGRDAQAEEILKDAILKEPKRYELHLKLLEMYAGRKDTSAFEAIAGELYTTLGADDPTWAKVAAMGATVEPENPLYDVSKIAAAATSLPTHNLESPDLANVAVSTDAGLDFSLDDDVVPSSQLMTEDANAVVTQSFSAAQNVDHDISFDLGSMDDESTAAASLENADINQAFERNVADNTHSFNPTADNSMDFDLGDFNLDTEESSESIALNDIDDIPSFTATKNDSFGAKPLDLSAMNESAVSQSNGFDMDFNFPADVDDSGLEQKSQVVSNTLDNISFDLDLASDAPDQSVDTQSDIASSEVSLDLPVNDDQVLSNSSETAQLAKEFDLSSISFDLGEAATEPSKEQPLTQTLVEPTQLTTVGIEPQDVDIKLDLVAAYIDMDDKEGARELLEEVIKQGGAQQQLRAQQLLASLA